MQVSGINNRNKIYLRRIIKCQEFAVFAVKVSSSEITFRMQIIKPRKYLYLIYIWSRPLPLTAVIKE